MKAWRRAARHRPGWWRRLQRRLVRQLQTQRPEIVGLSGLHDQPLRGSVEPVALAAVGVGGGVRQAERVFGDAGATIVERNAATLARWIIEEHPDEVHVRRMLREVRLPGMRSAEQVKDAAKILVEADWLRAPVTA